MSHCTISYLWISLYDDHVPYDHLVSYDHTITLFTLWWHWPISPYPLQWSSSIVIFVNHSSALDDHTSTLFTFISLSPYKFEWSFSIRALPKERLGGAALIRFINYLQDDSKIMLTLTMMIMTQAIIKTIFTIMTRMVKIVFFPDWSCSLRPHPAMHSRSLNDCDHLENVYKLGPGRPSAGWA